MIAPDPYLTVEHHVADRVRDDSSHRRIAAAITEVALDAIHPARHRGIRSAITSGMLEEPVERATHAAAETLITHLELLVEALPPSTIHGLDTEQLVAELGLE